MDTCAGIKIFTVLSYLVFTLYKLCCRPLLGHRYIYLSSLNWFLSNWKFLSEKSPPLTSPLANIGRAGFVNLSDNLSKKDKAAKFVIFMYAIPSTGIELLSYHLFWNKEIIFVYSDISEINFYAIN